MKLVEEKKEFARKHIKDTFGKKVVDDDQVIRICVDNNFDPEKIDKELNKYKTETKYAGIEAYEWNDVQSKTDKKAEAKKAHAIEEQKRIKLEKRIYREE